MQTPYLEALPSTSSTWCANRLRTSSASSRMMVAGDSVVGTDRCAAVVADGHRHRGLAARRTVEAIHDVSLVGRRAVVDG